MIRHAGGFGVDRAYPLGYYFSHNDYSNRKTIA